MFKLFKKQESNNVLVEEPENIIKAKTVNEIIEEIHETFYTEVDFLLSSAKISNSLDTDKQDLIDKCNRLKAIGFNNTKEVKEAEIEIDRLNKLQTENEEKIELIEAINYFSFKYPNYKFITEDSIKKICAKYNLIYGEISNYIGTVPDKNIKDMENFKIDTNDECYIKNTFGSITYLNIKQFEDEKEEFKENRRYYALSGMEYSLKKCSLEIAAPLKDFDAKNMEIKNFKLSKIEIPDPVVFQPVIYKNKKHFLIQTAWGLEASDEYVVNHKMN